MSYLRKAMLILCLGCHTFIAEPQKVSTFRSADFDAQKLSGRSAWIFSATCVLKVRKLFSRHIQKWVNPSRLSENWTTIYIIIQKLSRLSGNFRGYLETFQTVRKLSRLSWNFPDCPKPFLTFSTVRKLSKQSKKFPDCPEVFQTFQKLSGLNRLSRNFPDCAETFQTVRNLSRPMLCFWGQFCWYA